MRILATFFLFSVLFSCSKKNAVPPDVLPPENMQDLLWDLSRADQYTFDVLYADSTKKKESENNALYEKVFAIHRITALDFDRSYSYYKHHPDLFKIMLDTLQFRKTRLVEQYVFDTTKKLKNEKAIPVN